MITRSARLHELVCRTGPDGRDAHFVRATFDESASTVLRLAPEEHAALKDAMARGRRFVITLSIGAPSLVELAASDNTDGAA